MAVYSVFEGPRIAGDPVRRAERIAFVREGFSFGALIFGLAVGLRAAGLPQGERLTLIVLIAILVALEAPTLRRVNLRWRRWREVDLVVARNRDAAEQRFFARWAVEPAYDAPPLPPGRHPTVGPDIIGLFPQPGTGR